MNRMRNRLVAVAMIASGLALGATGALAQEPAQNSSQHAAQTPKKPRVWTNDDVNSLRSPSDQFLREKEQKDAQEPATKQAPSSMPPQSAAKVEGLPNVPAPTTVQDADQLIAQQEAELASQQEFVKQTEKELADADESQRPKLNGRIEYHTKVIGRIQAEIAQLQAERDALAKKPASPNGDSGSNANSSSPQI